MQTSETRDLVQFRLLGAVSRGELICGEKFPIARRGRSPIRHIGSLGVELVECIRIPQGGLRFADCFVEREGIYPP